MTHGFTKALLFCISGNVLMKYGTRDLVREALRKAQQSDGPVLIDCQIDKDERVLPMIPAGGTIDDLVVD